LIAGPSILAAQYEGAEGTRPLGDVFSGPVPVQDGYVAVTFSRAHFWRDAMNILGLSELADDPRYVDGNERRQHREALARVIEERLAGRARWDVFETLSAVRCVAG